MPGLAVLVILVTALGPANAGLTAQQQNEILDAHNNKRHELKLSSSEEPDLVSAQDEYRDLPVSLSASLVISIYN